MKNKNMISIFVCMLLIAVSFSSVTGTMDENETLKVKNDDYDNLIEQVIESGVISNNDWLEEDKLLASDGAADDRFGNSVSIDGDYAIVGALWDDDNGSDSGSAYVFSATNLSCEIKGGFGVNLVITNHGDSEAENLDVEIHVEGGILGLINKTAFGTINVPAGDSVTMGTGLLFGLGCIDIKATVAGEEKTATGTQIIILTLV